METKEQIIEKRANGNLEDLFNEIDGKVKQPVYWKTKAEQHGRDYWTNKILGF